MAKRPRPTLDDLIRAQLLIGDAILHWYHGGPVGLPKIVSQAIRVLEKVEKNPYGDRNRG